MMSEPRINTIQAMILASAASIVFFWAPVIYLIVRLVTR